MEELWQLLSDWLVSLVVGFMISIGLPSFVIEQTEGVVLGQLEEILPREKSTTMVTRVIDGDTIEIDTGEIVRFIGIDTPETGECYAPEATQKTKELLLHQAVELERDVSSTDRYQRLLRYVWSADQLVNQQLVLLGYAKATAYPPDTKYQEQLDSAQQMAQKNKVGIWQKCISLSDSASVSGEAID